MNNLLGILVRFRKEDVAIQCDVEQMFHSFFVNPEHRNYLRFFWFEDNNPEGPIIECHMNVHLFGNASSPAVATYGMRRVADEGEEQFGGDTKQFVRRDFYVDDGLASYPSKEQALSVVKRTQSSLKTANLRLHKIASNNAELMTELAADDRAKCMRDLDLQHDALPSLRSLGVYWDLQSDTFTFKVSLVEKPYTRRGILSTVNSIYDPLGLASPVTIKGRIILQRLTNMSNKDSEKKLEWDDPLPQNMKQQWKDWKEDLINLEKVNTPRCYHPKDFGVITRTEIHGFADANTDAVGIAVYIRMINKDGKINASLIYGQAKVAPKRLTTIPRLELCAAVMLAQAVHKLLKELHHPIDQVYLYTDSKIVLGYVHNESRRFYVYVANRVQTIRNLSNPTQWSYVDTESNPADLASRGIHASKIMETRWLKGPEFLWQPLVNVPSVITNEFSITDNDPDVRQLEVTAHSTDIATSKGLGTERFERFSNWLSVRRAMATVIVVRNRSKGSDGQPAGSPNLTAVDLLKSEKLIITTLQSEHYEHDIDILQSETVDKASTTHQKKSDALKNSRLYKLNPFVDDNGLIRVGGRLQYSDLEFNEKHPVILPKDHHVTNLIIRHYHEEVHHQGRILTHGAIRKAGFWVVGGQGMVSKAIHSCVTCRRLRGKAQTQLMANLPQDRLEVNHHSQMLDLMSSAPGSSRPGSYGEVLQIPNVGG